MDCCCVQVLMQLTELPKKLENYLTLVDGANAKILNRALFASLEVFINVDITEALPRCQSHRKSHSDIKKQYRA